MVARLCFIKFLISCILSAVAFSKATIVNDMQPKPLLDSLAPDKSARADVSGTKSYISFPYVPIDLSFHGGPVMDRGANVYIIWYGAWAESQKAVIRNFINSLGPRNADVQGSVRRWWKMNEVYYNSLGKPLSSNISLAGEATDLYSRGKSLSSCGETYSSCGDNISSIVSSLVSSTSLPQDARGIFLFLPSADVIVESFCTSRCGYHSYLTLNSVDYKLAVVANAEIQCPVACFAGGITDGARGMIDTIAHELTESLTDPSASGWFSDETGEESADMCEYTYGASALASDSTMFNLVGANNFKYLVQQNFNPKVGKCVLQEPYTSPPQLPSPYTPVGILYQGGAVLDKGVNVYLVWIGSWSANQKGIIRNFIQSMGAEEAGVTNSVRNWWKITSLYYNAKGQYLSPRLSLKKEYSTSTSGAITLYDFPGIVSNATSSRKLPSDVNGIYLLLTSGGIAVNYPLTDASACAVCDYLGYSKGLKWAWIGNAAQRCPGQCSTGNSTNGDLGVDSMVTWIARQMTKLATNPIGGFGWHSASVGANANFCGGEYGVTYGSHGEVYNLVGLNSKRYLVQQNWNPKTGHCVTRI